MAPPKRPTVRLPSPTGRRPTTSGSLGDRPTQRPRDTPTHPKREVECVAKMTAEVSELRQPVVSH
jgi:hypothetical protein